MQAANERGLAGKGKLPTVVTQAIAAKKKKFEDGIAQLNSDARAEQQQRRIDVRPREMHLGDYDTMNQGFDKRATDIATKAKANPNSEVGRLHGDSVLRYAGPDDQNTVRTIAQNIYRNNHGMSPQDAFDAALNATSIMRPSPDDKDPVGQNRQKGEKATRFKPINKGDRGYVYMRFGDASDVRVDT